MAYLRTLTSLRRAQGRSMSNYGAMPLKDGRIVVAAVMEVFREQRGDGQARSEYELIDLDTRSVYSKALTLGWSGSDYQVQDANLRPITRNLNSGYVYSSVLSEKIKELQVDTDPNGWDGDVVIAIPSRYRYLILGSLTHAHANEDIEGPPYADVSDPLYTQVDGEIGQGLDSLNEQPWPTASTNSWSDVYLQRFGRVVSNWLRDYGYVLDVREVQSEDPTVTSRVLSKLEVRKDRATMRGPEIQLRSGLPGDLDAGVHDDYQTLISQKNSGVEVRASDDAAHIEASVADSRGLRVQDTSTVGSSSGDQWHGVCRFPAVELILDRVLDALSELQTQYNALRADHLALAASAAAITGQGVVNPIPEDISGPTSADVTSQLYTASDVDDIRSPTVTVGGD